MLDHLTHADGIEVSIEHHPCARTEWEITRAPIGATVAEIVALSNIDCARFGTFPTVILLRGDRIDVVPLNMWRKVRPKSGTRVEIAFPMGEPGTLALIASAALPHAAAYAATALKLTGMYYALTVAAITVVGALTINALIPPAQQGGTGAGPQNFAITGVANVANRYGSFPYVIGRHRMFPSLTASGYSETVGRSIFYRGRMTFGYGPVALEDLRIGTTPIWEYDGVELEFLNVDRDRTLAAMPQLADLVITRTEEAQTPKAFVAPGSEGYVFAPGGLAKSASLTITPSPLAYYASLDVVVEVSEGGGAWSAVATYPGITGTVTFSAGAFSDGVQRSWRVRIAAATEAPAVPGSALRRKSSEGVTVTAASAVYQAPSAGWRKGSETMRLYAQDVTEDGYSDVPQHNDPVVKYTRLETTSAAIDLTFPQGLYKTRSSGKVSGHGTDFQFEYQSTEGGLGEADWIDLGIDNIHAKATTLFRWTKHISFPAPGEYAIRVTRRWLIDEDPGDVNTATLTAIRSFGDGDLPSHEGVAEVAFRIKASEQLNGQIDSLNAIVQQLAPMWDGSAWTEPQPIRHPAWAFLQALRGPHLRRPVPASRIDLEAFRAWAEQEPHWTCDYVIDTPTQVADVLDVIAASGRAKRTLTDLKWSVIRESAAHPVRQVFTPRNSWGFKAEHRFPREIHGFRVKVRSERLEWQEDEILVLMDGYTRKTASELETLELPGVVVTAESEDEGNAFRLARYHLAAALHRPATYTLQTGWEHLRVTRGDKVRLVHDAALIGVGQGRIKAVGQDGSGSLASITLDDCLYGTSGEFRLTVRTVAGEAIFTATAPADPTTRLWTVASGSGIAAADVTPGDLAIVEEVAQRSAEMLVSAIRPNTEDGAELVLVDAALEVLDADSGVIPPYDPVITEPRDPASVGLPVAPVVISAYSSNLTQLVLPDLSVRPRIAVQLAPFVTGAAAEGVTLQLRWSDAEAEAVWAYGEKVSAGEYTLLTGALEEGESYRVEVSSVGADGKTRGWVSAGVITATMAPPAPPLIAASAAPFEIPDAAGSARRPGILLSWPVPSNKMLRVTWQLRIAATGALVQRGLFAEASEGSVLISDGLVPGVAYQIRPSFVTGASDQRTWADWLDVTAPDVRLERNDLDDALTAELDAATAAANKALADAESADQHATQVQESLDAQVGDLLQGYGTIGDAVGVAEQARDDAQAASTSAAADQVAATQAADAAEQSATNAQGSASAASTSATAAATSSTEAGDSASAALGSANTASTAAGDAETYRDEAAVSASAAGLSSVAAQAAQGVAVSTVALNAHVTDFNEDGTYYTNIIIGDPLTPEGMSGDWTYVDTTEGRAATISVPPLANRHLVPRYLLRNGTGRTYRMRVKARYTGTGALVGPMSLQFRRIKADFTDGGAVGNVSVTFDASGQWQEFVHEWTEVAVSSLTPWIRGFVFAPATYTGSGTLEVVYISVEDVTEELKATNAATAAAGSAEDAAASASGATQAASAASTSETNASTSAGDASTAAGQASSSAAAAAGASNEAAEYSRLAAVTKRAASTRNMIYEPNGDEYAAGANPEFWNGSVTVGAGSPSAAPAGSKSLKMTDGAMVDPVYTGNFKDRRYRFSGWVYTGNQTQGTARFAMRGENLSGTAVAFYTAPATYFDAASTWKFYELDVVVTSDTSWIAPGIDLNGQAAGDLINLWDFRCVDVTEEFNADVSATAAASSATTAASSATTAGQQANTATTQAGLATTKAGEALTYSQAAAASASDADGRAVAAALYQSITARLAGQGVSCLPDPYFSTYGEAGGDWANFANGPSLVGSANDIFPVGKTLQFNRTDFSLNEGVLISQSGGWEGPENEDAYVVEVCFTYIGGTGISGAGILLDWNTTTTEFRASARLEDMINGPLKTGTPMFAQALLKRPAGFTGTFTTHDLWFIANYPNSGLGPNERKHLKLHYMQIRPASVDEIRNLETAATVTEDTQTLATLDGKARATKGIAVVATSGGSTFVSELRQTSYANPDGTGGSAIQLRADTIIADGTLAASKLAVGFGGNLLTNTGFWAGFSDWRTFASGGSGGQTSFQLREPGQTWAGLLYPTLLIYQSGTATDGYADITSDPVYTIDGDSGLGAQVTPDKRYEATIYCSTHRCTGQLRIHWLDEAGNSINYAGPTNIPTAVSDSANPDKWPRHVVRGVAPANAAYARIHIRKLGTLSGTNSYMFIHKPMLCEVPANATEMTPYSPGGSTFIDGATVKTGSLSALAIGADKMNARYLEITEQLALDAAQAGFTMGKTSAADLTNDGIYMGRTDSGGSIGFGFNVGVQSNGAGYPEYLRATEDTGIEIVNAKHYRNLTAASAPILVSTGQTITLPTTATKLNLEIVGGGGGGSAGGNDYNITSGSAHTGKAGTTTTVQLYDGTTLKKTWTAAGGIERTYRRSSRNGTYGDSSLFATGGRDGDWPDGSGQVGSLGSGGGGGGGGSRGGTGGAAGSVTTITGFDISTYTTPKITITVGSGGIGGIGAGGGDGGPGGRGGNGAVRYSVSQEEMIRADVIPLEPTAQGTMSNHGPFPNVVGGSAGLWIISIDSAAADVAFGQVEINDNGGYITGAQNQQVCFVSSKRPVVLTTPHSARTLMYQFFKMGD
ncbi:hypothetical protein IQ782_02915 [Salipiger pacificus]|uniref:Tip attachment protein J HDII-ins2 domain-containing protein n=1 Tax=Salipiger mangrovisoli TaxID=2865933 RepID=A0ABR9WWV3_9RHOB|nr:hypothetical protein [Salipiger mangrovisoli]